MKSYRQHLQHPMIIAPIERSSTSRKINLQKPIQSDFVELMDQREQPASVLIQDPRQANPSVAQHLTDVENQSEARTLYETADEVFTQYQNTPFMPQKNEGRDRLEVLAKSKEFNPVIEFEINSPNTSSQRTSAPQFNSSSRSNSDTLQMVNIVNAQNEYSQSSAIHTANPSGASTMAKQLKPGVIEI